MSKMLATLIAGVFAVSAFAADAPKPTTPDAKPAVEAKADVKAEAKTEKKVHKHHKAKKAEEKSDATSK